VPATWTCPSGIERVGLIGRGGRWVCGMGQIAETSKERWANFTKQLSSAPRFPDSRFVARSANGHRYQHVHQTAQEPPRQPGCVVYSIGVDGHTTAMNSFERELLDRTKCELWAYDRAENDDFVTRMEVETRDRAKFQEAVIGPNTDKAGKPPVYRISDLMEMNGHNYM
jgi:hypothetical protein